MSRATIYDEKSRARVIGVVAALDLGEEWEISIAPKKSKRSLSQNSMYWSWVTKIANETGHTASEIADWCKSEFLPRRFVTIQGKTRECQVSTTELNTAEMTDYLTRIEAWAGTFGIVLPNPNDRGRA